jgi:hypothetical protein
MNSTWHALWPFMIICLPLVFALRNTLNLSFFGLIINIISALLLTVLTVIVSLIILSLLATLIKKANQYFSFIHLSIRTLAIAIFIFISLVLLLVVATGMQHDLINMLQAENLEQGQAGIKQIVDNFQFLPSHLLASGLYYWQTGNIILMLSYHLELWLLVILFTAIAFYFSPYLIHLWSAYKTSYSPSESRVQASRIRSKKPARFVGGIYHSLVKKEAVVFIRNSRGLLWFSFLLLFWLLQTLINMNLSNSLRSHELSFASTPVLIQVMQLLTAVYFISAFALRFVFPSFSQERRTVWIMSSAPIDWKKVFYAKLVFYNLIFIFLGLIITYANLNSLALPIPAIFEIMILFFVMIIFTVTLSLSLGMIFPNFETDDPSALGTSLPGLALIFISLIFGSLSAWSLYLKLIGFTDIFYYGFISLSLIAIIILIFFAPHRYAKLDKIKVI